MDMGVEDVCDTGLVLGLAYEGKNDLTTDRHSYRDTKLNRRRSSPIPLETSLTLSLSDDTYASIKGKLDATKVSSFENAYRSGAKKERDIGSEEVEVGRASKVSDREEDGYSKKKLRLSREQSALLDDTFKQHATLNPKQKQALAKQLNLRPRQVEVWFQNRRARTKLKQTEVDCQFLKKCYETLTDENRRLQKELQELRAIRFAAPLFMQLPAATITMCPSCKRIAGASDDSKGSSLMVAPKPHFIGPFAHSATC